MWFENKLIINTKIYLSISMIKYEYDIICLGGDKK